MSEEWSCPTAGACSARGSDHCTPQDGCTASVESLIGDLAIERGWTNEARDEIARLKAENERLNQLSIDLRACMVEARHKWGLEQDKNDKLWAVAEAARKVSSYTRTEPVDDIVNVLDALDDALAALDEEVGE